MNPENIDMKKVAIAEAVMALGLLYSAGSSKSIITKLVSLASAAYLGYGSYLNTQDRVKILPPQK